MDDPAPLRGRRLRRADVEAAVDLPRVGGDRSRPGDPAAISASASAIARPVLPVAVGPPMTTSGGRASTRQASAPRSAYGPACSIADVDQRARRGPATPRRGRACSRASGRPGARRRRAGARTRRATPRSRPPPRRRGRGCAAGPRCRPAPRSSGPTHARFRSSPIALLERQQLVQPAALLGGGHVVGEARRGRPGPLAVRGREHLVVADGLEQPERRLVLGLGLAAEPDDDVGRERDARAPPRGSGARRSR